MSSFRDSTALLRLYSKSYIICKIIQRVLVHVKNSLLSSIASQFVDQKHTSTSWYEKDTSNSRHQACFLQYHIVQYPQKHYRFHMILTRIIIIIDMSQLLHTMNYSKVGRVNSWILNVFLCSTRSSFVAITIVSSTSIAFFIC